MLDEGGQRGRVDIVLGFLDSEQIRIGVRGEAPSSGPACVASRWRRPSDAHGSQARVRTVRSRSGLRDSRGSISDGSPTTARVAATISSKASGADLYRRVERLAQIRPYGSNRSESTAGPIAAQQEGDSDRRIPTGGRTPQCRGPGTTHPPPRRPGRKTFVAASARLVRLPLPTTTNPRHGGIRAGARV